MPHLKVKPFDSAAIEKKLPDSSIMTFRAKALKGDDEIIGVEHGGEEFLLQIKPDNKATLVKYDKVTRPLKVNLLKEALDKVSKELGLKILSSNIALSNGKPPLASEYFKKIEDFETIEYPKEKISVEVGFGSGRHLLYQAQKNPDTLFIGLEIHTPSAQQVLRQIELQGLENIWVVNYDARLFLEMLPSNRCEQIFVHFPVPWDKKPHRRVISTSFLAESMRVLRRGGRLELRTDSDKYFWYALETFFAVPKTEVEIRKNEALEVTSKYEARWRKQEKDIYDVYVKCSEDSDERDLRIDFKFTSVKYTPNLEECLPKNALVFDGYFVHFERSYKVGDNALLVKCAFGSFDRPEHKYILVEENESRYFASQPVKTTVNYAAHQKIVELLTQKENNV
ncbi:tRNA (guanosine(46)-N7)-methyltransferase TrmB [Sulfurovum sp. NBC37-1]|uniref:tRNA (guanosine(46)-N7)-methyltransferase TrmB n=1 Tax=Sulfurovum sp. (strain NBC37-1) TaxID=387093 RepID=UPI00015879F8|nr:tRNA (guanosine(46)-N7)-methyltransferase TrmB [Sulfurovum sp. NBC37-1]BAF72698.1 tRNA (guanine-N(7)-)-methyltransferase [Sulfurovum sp. NBC37-1]